MEHEADYNGYGHCAACNPTQDRRQAPTMGRYRPEDAPGVTVDRCRECGREWMLRDGQRRWVPW